jgi:hypothetical protein
MNGPQHIPPGTLELYVLGALSAEESRYIRDLAQADAELRASIHGLEQRLEDLAWQGAITPPAHLRARILERIAGIAHLPSLLHGSTATDFMPWLEELPPLTEAFDNMHVAPLSFADRVPTALVWVKSHVEEEIHTDVLESFLILEGTCQVRMEGKVIDLVPGDVMHIPLHTPHSIQVTSATPCKAIVQRVAA